MREPKIIKNSPKGGDFGVFEPFGVNLRFQEFQNELKGIIFRRILRKLKMFFCDHKQIIPLFQTRHYTTTPGTNFRFWQDCIIGTGCADCGKVMLMITPFDIGNIDHIGCLYSAEKPHFPEF